MSVLYTYNLIPFQYYPGASSAHSHTPPRSMGCSMGVWGDGKCTLKDDSGADDDDDDDGIKRLLVITLVIV